MKERVKRMLLDEANKAVADIAKELSLKQVPTVVMSEDQNGFSFVTWKEEYQRGSVFTQNIVVSTEPEYVVHICNSLIDMVDTMYLFCMKNNKFIADVAYCICLHECRHIHQAETGFFNGEIREMFVTDNSYSRAEKDSDNYMLSHAGDKELVAKFFQLKNYGNYVKDWELMLETDKAEKMVYAHYAPLFYMVMELLSYLTNKKVWIVSALVSILMYFINR